MVLDDSFSALDSKTENQVVASLLGANGHFRKLSTTVILTANSGTLTPIKTHEISESCSKLMLNIIQPPTLTLPTN